MKKEDKHFEWLKHRYKWDTISGILTFPFLIIMYYLGYKTATWVFFSLMILNEILVVQKYREISEKAGMDKLW